MQPTDTNQNEDIRWYPAWITSDLAKQMIAAGFAYWDHPDRNNRCLYFNGNVKLLSLADLS